MSRNNEFDMGLPPDPIADSEAAVLDYGHQTAGRYVTDEEVMSRLGITSEMFYRKLSRLIDDPAAMFHNPEAVEKLRQVRNQGVVSMNREEIR